MEREIGEIFTLNGKQFEVKEGTCIDCYFANQYCFLEPIISSIGRCGFRKDRKEVCFKLIEKDGDKKKR